MDQFDFENQNSTIPVASQSQSNRFNLSTVVSDPISAAINFFENLPANAKNVTEKAIAGFGPTKVIANMQTGKSLGESLYKTYIEPLSNDPLQLKAGELVGQGVPLRQARQLAMQEQAQNMVLSTLGPSGEIEAIGEKGLKALGEEATKYKSAEEFVQSQFKKQGIKSQDEYSFRAVRQQLTDFYNQATKGGEDIAERTGEIGKEFIPNLAKESRKLGTKTPVPKVSEPIPNVSLPQSISKEFKYVKNEPFDFTIGENDVKTARGIREQYSGVKNAQIVRGNQLAQEIRREVPNKLEREGMFWYKAAKGDEQMIQEAIKNPKFADVKQQLEKALNLSDKAHEALTKGQQYYNEAGLVSKGQGTIQGIKENYQNRIYSPEPPKDFVKSELGRGVSTYTSHGKARVFDTEFDAIKAGKTFATTDFADALAIHNEEMARVNTASKLYQALPETGIAAKVPIGQTPSGWEKLEGFKQFPQTEEVVAPKGIAKGLRAITEPDFTKRIDSLRSLAKYQGLVKTVDLAYSFFHHFTMAMQTIYQGIGRDILKLPVMDKIMATEDFMKLEQHFVRRTGITSNVQVNQDILRNITQKNPDIFSKITNLPIVKQALNLADKNTDFLFGKMQRFFKVTDFGEQSANWIAKHPNATEVEIAKAETSMAREINNAYGGLNWEAMGMTKSNLALLRTLLIAPDWNVSNIELVRQAFEQSPGGAAARRSLIGGFIKGVVLTEFFNKMLTGHFTDQNSKGHGLEIEVAPNVYISFLRGGLGDLAKWASFVTQNGMTQGTSRFLQGKMAPFPRTGVGLLSGIKYTGQTIAPREAGPLKRDLNYLEYIGQSAGPVPFGLSNMMGSQTTPLGKTLIGAGIGRYSAPKKSAETSNRFNF